MPANHSTITTRKVQCRRKRPTYREDTKALARWLFTYLPPDHYDRSIINRADWGFWNRKTRKPEYESPSYRLEEHWQPESTGYLARLTRTTLQSHLDGHDQLYATCRRASPVAYIVIDVDAHRGQTDAWDTTHFILARFFADSYHEPSPRGYHIHLAVHVGFISRRDFNRLLADAQSALSIITDDHGFESSVEIKGSFTIRNDEKRIELRGSLAPLPALKNGMADANRLIASPGYFSSILNEIIDEANLIREFRGEKTAEPLAQPAQKQPNLTGRTDWRNSPDAFTRMNGACFEFTRRYYRLPDVGELVEWYAAECELATVDADTYIRAESVIERRGKVFDISRATEAGFTSCRENLLADIRRFCIDRSSKYHGGITDDDLAVALYTITRNSFVVHDRAIRQYSCPVAAISGMFDCLRDAGVIHRFGRSRHKIGALKKILERADLIECLDERWIHLPEKNKSTGMKWIIGVNHYRHKEWTTFSHGITYERVGIQTRPHRKTIASEVYVPCAPAMSTKIRKRTGKHV